MLTGCPVACKQCGNQVSSFDDDDDHYHGDKDDDDDDVDDDDEDGDDNEDMCVQCQDYNAYCAAWAREGQCRKNQAYMDIYCAKVGRTSSDYVEINLGIQDFS